MTYAIPFSDLAASDRPLQPDECASLRRPGVWTNNLVALLIVLGLYAMFAFLPEFVQTPSSAGYGFGASITRSGMRLFDASLGLDTREGIELTPTRVVQAPAVTHIRYTVGSRVKLELDDRGAGGV